MSPFQVSRLSFFFDLTERFSFSPGSLNLIMEKKKKLKATMELKMRFSYCEILYLKEYSKSLCARSYRTTCEEGPSLSIVYIMQRL